MKVFTPLWSSKRRRSDEIVRGQGQGSRRKCEAKTRRRRSMLSYLILSVSGAGRIHSGPSPLLISKQNEVFQRSKDQTIDFFKRILISSFLYAGADIQSPWWFNQIHIQLIQIYVCHIYYLSVTYLFCPVTPCDILLPLLT